MNKFFGILLSSLFISSMALASLPNADQLNESDKRAALSLANYDSCYNNLTSEGVVDTWAHFVCRLEFAGLDDCIQGLVDDGVQDSWANFVCGLEYAGAKKDRNKSHL